MKLLPCSNTRDCARYGALLPPSRAYPNGEPAISGRHVPKYKCARCKKPSELSEVQWNRLQTLKLEDFPRLAQVVKAPALADFPLKDFVVNGLTKEQAKQTFEAGFLDTLEAEKDRETVAVVVEAGTWHSADSDVYHDRSDCQTGDNISKRHIQAGKGGKRRCTECATLAGERRKGKR